MENKKDWVGPIILISFGIVFLLNNFGLLPWSVWGMIWRLWPLALIIPGIVILVRGR